MRSELDVEHILALCRGFMEPRLMLSAVELDLFSIIRGHWLSVEDIAIPRHWDPRALRILLDALTVVGLADKRNGKYSTTELSAEMLSSEGALCVRDNALHAAECWHHWSQLTDRIVASGSRPPMDHRRAFIGTMESLAPRLAPGMAALIKPERGRRFIDIGGGGGAYTVAFLTRDRTLDATLFDLPEVLPICEEYLRDADCFEGVRLVAGDFTRDEFPPGQDLAFLSAIVHLLPMEQNYDLLRRVYRSLNPGGRVVIRDHVMSADRLQPRAGTLFAVEMLVATDGGDTYTFRELKGVLEDAGFIEVRLLQDGERMNAVIEAFRPTG